MTLKLALIPVRELWIRALSFGVDLEIRYDFRQLQHRVPHILF